MDFSLSEEQLAVQSVAQEFAQRHLTPEVARGIDRSATMPETLMQALGESQLHCMAVPEQFGGQGIADTIAYALVMETIARSCASTSVFVTVSNSLVVDPLMHFANPDQQQVYLSRMAKGEFGAYALTGPSNGSDARHPNVWYQIDGNGVILKGEKTFISCSNHAGFFLVFASKAGSDNYRDMRVFIVDRDVPGLTITPEDKMGIRGSGSSSLNFEDVRIPIECMFGDAKNHGFKIAMMTIECGRIGIAAQSVGIAQHALDEAIKYAKTRPAFGQMLTEFQATQFRLADMAMAIETARLMTFNAAWLHDQGKPFGREAAMAKLFASEMLQRVAYDAVQIHGGYGFIREFTVEQLYRDARITTLYEGTSEMQRLVIARDLLK